MRRCQDASDGFHALWVLTFCDDDGCCHHDFDFWFVFHDYQDTRWDHHYVIACNTGDGNDNVKYEKLFLASCSLPAGTILCPQRVQHLPPSYPMTVHPGVTHATPGSLLVQWNMFLYAVLIVCDKKQNCGFWISLDRSSSPHAEAEFNGNSTKRNHGDPFCAISSNINNRNQSRNRHPV